MEYPKEPYKGRMSTFIGQSISLRTHIYGKGSSLYWMQQNYMNGNNIIIQIAYRLSA